MKIEAPFTVAAVGDVFGAMAPITPLEEPRLQNLLNVIRAADVGIANAESSIADLPRFTGPFGGLLAPKAAAADMRAMGIAMVNRANNLANIQPMKFPGVLLYISGPRGGAPATAIPGNHGTTVEFISLKVKDLRHSLGLMGFEMKNLQDFVKRYARPTA